MPSRAESAGNEEGSMASSSRRRNEYSGKGVGSIGFRREPIPGQGQHSTPRLAATTTGSAFFRGQRIEVAVPIRKIVFA